MSLRPRALMSRAVVPRAGSERQRGQVIVLFAGAVMTLLIMAAFAFDVGMMLVERRDQQNAADAAALAGARYVFDADCEAPDWACPKARAAAIEVARLNGYDDADEAESVVVRIPSEQGRYAGLPNFVEVDIGAERDSIFAGVIGRSSWPVSVFAVATNDQDLGFPFAMLALNPTACKAIAVSGTGEVVAYGNIQSNSNGSDCTGDPIGFSRTGAASIDIIAPDAACRSAGGILDQGSGSMTCTPVENSFALPDPLAGLGDPAMPALAPPMVFVGPGTQPTEKNKDSFPDSCPGDVDAPPSASAPATCRLAPKANPWKDKAWILYPGLYPGGLEITSGTTAYLMPGVYWIGGGGLTVSTGGAVVSIAEEANATATLPTHADWATWDSGVLLFNSSLPNAAGGPIRFEGTSATMLLQPLDIADTSPPDPDAEFNDLVIYQDRTLSTDVTLNGSASTAEAAGIIYVPGANVKLNGNGGSLVVDEVIADTYLIDGNGGTINVLRRIGVDSLICAAGLVD